MQAGAWIFSTITWRAGHDRRTEFKLRCRQLSPGVWRHWPCRPARTSRAFGAGWKGRIWVSCRLAAARRMARRRRQPDRDYVLYFDVVPLVSQTMDRQLYAGTGNQGRSLLSQPPRAASRWIGSSGIQ